MHEATSGLQLGVCLGVILLVFADASTASNLPKEKLLELVKGPDTLESSTFELTNPILPQQDEEEEEEHKRNDFNLSNFTENNNKDENELEQTTIIATSIMTINETNHDIVDELELVTNPMTITIESTTISQLLENELETFDRTEKRNDTLHNDEKQNLSPRPVGSMTRDFITTTNIPITSVPATTMLPFYLSGSTEKRPELTKDSIIVTTISRDTSIYENTIDRKDSAKKSIVTEPSVVLENSIQQSGSGYKLKNITSESTSSVLPTGTIESTSIASSTDISIRTLTSSIPLSYVTSESDDLREKPDFTGNGITENSSPITSTKVAMLFTPSNASISTLKTEAWTTKNEMVDEITSSDYYTTLGTSDTDFSTETTIESSDVSSTSLEPTSSLSSTSSSTSTVEYEFFGLTERSTNAFATTSSSFIENASTAHDLTNTSNNNNDNSVSDSFSNTRSLSETVSWPRMMTERTVPGTLSPSTSISTNSTANSVTNITVNTTDDNIESTNVATTVESTTESLDSTPIVHVVTLDIPNSVVITMNHNNQIPTGKKATDIITVATTTTTTTTATTTTTTTTTTEGPPPDDVTSLVKIIFEGTRQDVCPHLEVFRKSLAIYLSTGLGKTFIAKQIYYHQNSCNGPSNDENLFSIFVYVVDENGKFDATATKNLPNLYKSLALNSPITVRSILLVQETDSSNAIAVIVVSVVAFICLLLLAGLLFVMRKRQTRFNYGERCRPVSLDAYSLDSVSAYNSVRRKGVARSSKRSYGNPAFEDSSAIPSHPLNFAGLSAFSNDIDAINEEFSAIPQVSAKMDELPPGAEVKNRYANVIPLPESKVPLRKLNDDPLSEYINANYVRGPKNATKYYIACQAPLDTTVTDFWRMIWEQQCKVIIMLTDLVENGVEKCTEYIPPSEVTDCHRLYGDYQVTLKKRETKEKYAISTLHLKNLENNTFREVYHIWYLWPTTGLQSDGAGLIAVLLEARALQRGGPGPIVVHCSPGTGRTGTLIALDLGIRQYEITRTVDVPRVVYTIRRDRAGAVQTKEQYAFIYKALNLYAAKLAGGMLEST